MQALGLGVGTGWQWAPEAENLNLLPNSYTWQGGLEDMLPVGEKRQSPLWALCPIRRDTRALPEPGAVALPGRCTAPSRPNPSPAAPARNRPW